MAKYDEKFREALRESIKALPSKPKRELTAREIVESLRRELREKQPQGWSMKELAQFLAERGIRLSAATLRDYLSGQKKRRARRKGSGQQTVNRKGKGATAEPILPMNESVTATESNTADTAVPTPPHTGLGEGA
jgi:hypothetical protein